MAPVARGTLCPWKALCTCGAVGPVDPSGQVKVTRITGGTCRTRSRERLEDLRLLMGQDYPLRQYRHLDPAVANACRTRCAVNPVGPVDPEVGKS